MAIIVQKYGGSSVATAEKIKNVAKRIGKVFDGGDQVSSRFGYGRYHQRPHRSAGQVTSDPHPREMDVLLSTGELVASTLLAMAIRSFGYKAISLSGAQAGIKTDTTYRKAKIVKIDTKRIVSELEKGHIVIVAGFQGITDDMDITTLGRGGSDTSAVALAAALGAKVCERLTDTDGIYSAYPRVVPEAKRLAEIGYEEMLQLATYGNKVMQPRAIELAELYHIPIRVASSFSDNPGTLIHGGSRWKSEIKSEVLLMIWMSLKSAY